MLVQGLRLLRSQRPGALLTACYAGLFMFGARLGPGRPAFWSLVGGAVVAGIAWAAALRRARAISELATSRIGSAAQGYVEIMGRASVDTQHLIVSPLGGIQCIWYRYRLYSKDNSEREWNQTDSGVSSATFEINDGSGVCNVDPDHAEVVGAEVRTTYPDSDSKLVEELLFGGNTVYVLGEFTTIGGANSALSVKEDMGTLLSQWKADHASLLRRFDTDRSGAIDLKEWETARRLANKTVEQQHREIRTQSGIHMLRAPNDDRLFLISALSPERMRKRFIYWSYFHLAVGLGAVGVLIRFN